MTATVTKAATVTVTATRAATVTVTATRAVTATTTVTRAVTGLQQGCDRAVTGCNRLQQAVTATLTLSVGL